MKRIKGLFLCILMTILLGGTVVMGNYMIRSIQEEKSHQKQASAKSVVKEWDEPDEKMLDYYEIGEFSTPLPVLYMDTKGQQILKENKIWGSIALLNANGEEHSVFSVPDSSYPVTIKYRGASSYIMFDKKQYRIKFYKEKKNSAQEVSLAGMGKNSEWILNGPYLDKSLVRNKLVYDLGRELNGWAPDSRFVELFVDGEYQGVYLAVEPVTNGETRLRLSKFGLLSGATAYIVNRDRIDTEEEELETYGKTAGYTNNAVYVSYPSQSNITEKQKEYIQKDFSAFEKALYGENYQDERVGYRAYIDLDNWVDYFIINELAMNYDAGNLSTYVYKELGGKLQLAIWDFNNAFDNYQWFSLKTDQFNITDNSWFDRLCQDPAFMEQVKARYQELRESTLSWEHILEKLSSYEEELGSAIERNFKIWGYSFKENLLIGANEDGRQRDIDSYEMAVEQLKATIMKRLAFMDKELDYSGGN